MMSKLAIRHIVADCVRNLRPVCFTWKKDELSFRVDKFLNQPWTSDTIDLYLFTCDPLHNLLSFNLGHYNLQCERKPFGFGAIWLRLLRDIISKFLLQPGRRGDHGRNPIMSAA